MDILAPKQAASFDRMVEQFCVSREDSLSAAWIVGDNLGDNLCPEGAVKVLSILAEFANTDSGSVRSFAEGLRDAARSWANDDEDYDEVVLDKLDELSKTMDLNES